MTVSEGISALSLVISAGALVYAARSFEASRRAIQLQVFDGIFRDIKQLDAVFSAEFKSQGTKPTARWCQDFFNTLEYMAFLLNHKMILREEMHDFFRDAVVHWYATFAANATRADLDNPAFFPEFKKLYRTLKNGGGA
jgi:hypothetical protein